MVLCGCSSVVERHVPNVHVAGPIPVTRFYGEGRCLNAIKAHKRDKVIDLN